MQINIPTGLPAGGPVLVGNIYAARGGIGRKRPDTKYWVVVAVAEHSVSALGLDEHGNVVTTANYLPHTFERRSLVGHVAGLDNLRLGG